MNRPKIGGTGRHLLRGVLDEAERLGFVSTFTSGGHVVARHPKGGAPVYFAASSKSGRGQKDAIAMLRRVARALP